MNKSLKIQSGKWKGKSIPIPIAVKGHKQFTPSLIKKSVFGRINSHSLNGSLNPSKSVFIDLFAGSGQMGWEALSIGFESVFFMELDKNRFSSLLELGKEWSLKQNVRFFRKDGFRFFHPLEKESEYQSIVYFLDPPYSFWENQMDRLIQLIEKIQNSEFETNIFLFIQSPIHSKLPLNNLSLTEANFGSNSLYSFEKIQSLDKRS